MATDDLIKRQASLSNQGQVWKNLADSVAFKKPTPLFDQPKIISLEQLRGLRMVDETVVVHGNIKENTRNGGEEKK